MFQISKDVSLRVNIVTDIKGCEPEVKYCSGYLRM